MHVRIPSDLLLGLRTNNARVAVSLQCPLPNAIPTLPIRFVPPALPVRMPVTSERLGEPGSPTLLATDGNFSCDSARVSLDSFVAHRTRNLSLPAGPLGVVLPFHNRGRSPFFVFDTRRAVQPFFLRRIVLELVPTEFTLGRFFSSLVVRMVLSFERNGVTSAFLRTVFLFVLTVKLSTAVTTLSVWQQCIMGSTMVNSKPTSAIKFIATDRTRVLCHRLSGYPFRYKCTVRNRDRDNHSARNVKIITSPGARIEPASQAPQA